MLYYFLRLLIRIACRVYFRRIFVIGQENIPANHPIILAANHSNSFMEGILMAVLLPQKIWFLARADAFRHSVANWFLRSINLIPIFRFRDGYQNLNRNDETFRDCEQILQKKGTILIFPEGNCVMEKRLRILQKGAARLALGTEKRYSIHTQVIPVGINYTFPDCFRKEVIISFAKPIQATDFLEKYRQNERETLAIFTETLAQKLQNEVIVIENSAKEATIEAELEHYRSEQKYRNFQWKFTNENRLRSEQKITKNTTIHEPYHNSIQFNWLFWLAYLPNAIPCWLALKFTDNAVQKPDFRSATLMLSGMLFWLLYYGIACLLYPINALILPLMGILSLKIYDFQQDYRFN